MPEGKGTYGSKRGRPRKAGNKEGKAKLGGKTIRFEEGGLKRSLKVPDSYKFSKSQLERYNKKEVGQDISVDGKKIKITPKIKKQLTLGINLMSKKNN